VESQLPKGVGKESSRVQTPGLRVSEVGRGRELSMGSVTQGQKNSVQLLFKDSILCAHKVSVLILQQPRGPHRTPAWLNKQLLGKLHGKSVIERLWTEDFTSKEEFRNREGFRKAKSPQEVILARGSKGIRMSC